MGNLTILVLIDNEASCHLYVMTFVQRSLAMKSFNQLALFSYLELSSITDIESSFILYVHLTSILVFSWVRTAQSLAFCVVMCRWLLVFLHFVFWLLYYLSFSDWRFLITLLVSSKRSFIYFSAQTRSHLNCHSHICDEREVGNFSLHFLRDCIQPYFIPQ